MPRRYRRRSYDPGLERARRHVGEARALSRELCGTDADVKRYFLGLSAAELRPVLDHYEREHGRAARRYAEETIPAWRSGSVKVSGQTAERLFRLLPRFMPLDRKYSLVESLWERLAPRSESSIAFGPNADPREVAELVGRHMAETVNGHDVPDALQRRFEWLAAGDAQVMQQLLNHFLLRDRRQAIEAVGAEVELILRHPRDGAVILGFHRTVKVGGHTIHVFLDPRATGVQLSPGAPRYQPAPDYSWIGGWVVFAAVIAALMLLAGK